MYISRLAETKLKELLNNQKVIIMLGARQVGKTTLIEHILREYDGKIFNLDIEVDKIRLMAVSHLSPIEAIKSLGNPALLIVDEAQRLPEIGRVVKGWYDAHVPTKIILLGSSSLNLLDQSAESLTGRNVKLYLPPLLFNEILNNQSWYLPTLTKDILKNTFYNQINALVVQQMILGSYPETVVIDKKEQYLLNLTSDYLLKDVFQSNLIKSPETIKRLLMLLAYQTGAEVSLNELATNLQISRVTVERYLELLEKSFVIFRLPAFSSNLRKEIVKSTKIFFWDTGVRNAILKDFNFSEYRSDRGALWENWVIAEIAKKNLLAGQPNNLYFWRTQGGGEVDLIIKGGNIFEAYEIKWSKAKVKKVRSFSNKYHIGVQTITRDNVIDFL